jgi:sporulation protein YlmC with PRC-barrel domain
VFVFFSLLLNRKVFDVNRRKVGVVYDISFQLSEQLPQAVSLIVSYGSLDRKYADVPWECVEGINVISWITVGTRILLTVAMLVTSLFGR